MSWSVDLTTLEITEDDVAAVLDCLRQGWLTMGPRTEAFEAQFAGLAGGRRAVAVSSGTAALHLAARAAGLGPGDEVIVPSLTFVATAAAARFAGAEPVLCDSLGIDDFNLDPADVERRITPRTKAIIAVHFGGYAADGVALRELCADRDLVLIEDCAQAVGARGPDGAQVGTYGALGCFSFFSKKQLSLGEGGMVVAADEQLSDQVRLLRSHAMTSGTWDRHRGHADSYDIVDIGYNFRIDEPRAALGLSRLARLEDDTERRREHVRAYRAALAGLPGLSVPFDDAAVEAGTHFAFFVVLSDRGARDAFRESLADAGIQTTAYPAIHRFSDYERTLGRISLPQAEAIADRHCALPLSPGLLEEDRELVIAAVRRWSLRARQAA